MGLTWRRIVSGGGLGPHLVSVDFLGGVATEPGGFDLGRAKRLHPYEVAFERVYEEVMQIQARAVSESGIAAEERP